VHIFTFSAAEKTKQLLISYRLTIIVLKVHVPPKEKRTVSEVARVRQRLIKERCVFCQRCKCENRKTLQSPICMRIKCILRYLLFVFAYYTTLYLLFILLCCWRTLTKVPCSSWPHTACNCQHWENDDIKRRFVNFY
jgi:hypothetical protein